MPVPSLPPEIISAIIKQLEPDRSTYARCCLVSRAFLPFAREELYRRVHVVSPSDSPSDSQPASLPLLSVLVSSPHLAQFVLDMSFSAASSPSSPASSHAPSDFQDVLACILTACQRLVALKSSPPGSDASGPMAIPLKQALEGLGSRLKMLSIYGTYWSSGMRKALEVQVALKSLSLDLSWRKKQLGRPSFRLRYFTGRASFDSDVEWKAVRKLFKASRSTLSVLHLETAYLPSVVDDLDLARYVALRSLNLTCDLEDEDTIQPMLELVKSCPTLRYLDLSNIDLFAESTSRLEDVDFLRLFPPSLHTISMAFLPFATSYLLDVLADNTCLRGLKKLGLDHRLPVEGDETEPRPRPFEELDTIAGAGRKRGIEVDWETAEYEQEYYGAELSETEDGGAE